METASSTVTEPGALRAPSGPSPRVSHPRSASLSPAFLNPRRQCKGPRAVPGRALPGVGHREAAPLPDALIHQQLSEKAGRVPGRAARGNLRGRGSVSRQPRELKFEVHLLLESLDANLRLRSSKLLGGVFGCHVSGEGSAGVHLPERSLQHSRGSAQGRRPASPQTLSRLVRRPGRGREPGGRGAAGGCHPASPARLRP